MRLGNFSVSLAVKDLAASREFYEKLGFHVIGGDGRNFSILQNEAGTIGLFQGMFDKNILTFNPGWDRAVRSIARVRRCARHPAIAHEPGPGIDDQG